MRKGPIALTVTAMMTLSTLNVSAAPGESGYFGGISEGILLPKTITTELNKQKAKEHKLYYKEVIFITGEPIEVTGFLTIKKDSSSVSKNTQGTYKETYDIEARSADGNTELKRKVTLDTLFVKYDNLYSTQVKTDSTVTSWKESLKVNGTTYTVDEELSDFGKGRNFASYIEDVTPGIRYFNGNQSYRLVYKLDKVVYAEVTMSGNSLGFDEPWSKAENQSYTMAIEKKGFTTGEGDQTTSSAPWQMTVTINPFVNSSKSLDYKSTNLPAISFAGTFTQQLMTEGGMSYRIETNHPTLRKDKYNGSYYLKTPNDFEKLRIPGKMTYLNAASPAYSHVTSLMALGIIEETPIKYQPFEAISRSEYTTLICRAMNVLPPTDKEIQAFKKSGEKLFPDVSNDHALYNWIYAAKEARLIQGKDNNFFHGDAPLTREEAIALVMRVIGLEHISADVSQQTPYLDDGDISNWARDAIYAAAKLGIYEAENGRILPKRYVSRAEASVFVNQLINFLRDDMIEFYQNN